jgi:hypothetical protein
MFNASSNSAPVNLAHTPRRSRVVYFQPATKVSSSWKGSATASRYPQHRGPVSAETAFRRQAASERARRAGAASSREVTRVFGFVVLAGTIVFAASAMVLVTSLTP